MTIAAAEPPVGTEELMLYPKQRDALYGPERYRCIEASTKAGKTTAAMEWIKDMAWSPLGGPGKVFWWVAPVYSQSLIPFRRMSLGLRHAGIETAGSRMEITCPNGSVIAFKSADKPENLFGEDVCALVIDEAGDCDEKVWPILRSTLTRTRGPVRLIGTVRGRRTWFYQMSRMAEAGARPNWGYSLITAADAVEAGVFTQDDLDDARSQLPEDEFQQLYFGVPRADAGNPFGESQVRSCILPESEEVGVPVAFGVDLGKVNDFTAVIGLDRNGYVASIHKWKGIDWVDTAVRIHGVVRGVPSLVDSTGLGDPMLDLLREYSVNYEGYPINHRSRLTLLRGLQLAIQGQRLRWKNDGLGKELTEELLSFGVEAQGTTGVKYVVPPGQHDDLAFAAALAQLAHSSFVGRDAGDMLWMAVI